MTAMRLRDREGAVIPLELGRWRAEPDAVEHTLLASLPDPVLDIGCGPGRIAAAVAATGRRALGIDPSPAAVSEAVARGAPALCRSVFEPLPGEGRWGSAVLLDGNIGIGGDPEALLVRIAVLLRRGGHVLAEVEPPGTPTQHLLVRVEHLAHGALSGPWFPWSRVGVDAVTGLLAATELVLVGIETGSERWFARAVKP